MKQQQPHVLAIPFPAQGHMNPMLHLCGRLASSGFLITILVAIKKSSLNISTTTTTAGGGESSHSNLRFVFPPDESVLDYTTSSLSTAPLVFLSQLEANMKPFVRQLVDDIMADDCSLPRLTCIISDVAIVWSQDVARDCGIAKASLSTFAASLHSICCGLPLLKEQGLLPARGGTGRVVDFIPGLPLISAADLPEQLQEAEPFDPEFKIRFERHQILKKEDWVFLNTFHEMEPSQLDQLAIDEPNYLAVGPLLPAAAFASESCNKSSTDSDERIIQTGVWKEDVSCLEWLDEQPDQSVLYISFGSLATMSLQQLREICVALEKISQPFLWVIRPGLIEDGQLEMTKQNSKGMFVPWAPQLKVLKHRSVAAFLTHCGWNSITEAVVCGVPIVGWPCLFEQGLNCALAVQHMKIGVRVIPPEQRLEFVSSEKISGAIQEVMGDLTGKTFRANVTRLSNAARDAVFNEDSSSHKTLQAFIRDMKQRAASDRKKLRLGMV